MFARTVDDSHPVVRFVAVQLRRKKRIIQRYGVSKMERCTCALFAMTNC